MGGYKGVARGCKYVVPPRWAAELYYVPVSSSVYLECDHTMTMAKGPFAEDV